MSTKILDEVLEFEGEADYEEAFEGETNGHGEVDEYGAESLIESGEDDVEVSSEGGTSFEEGEFDEAFFGEEGASAAENYSGIEAVAGFDELILDASRESLAEQLGDEKLLDAWYADLGDPAIGALLQQPSVSESLAEVVIGKDDRIRINATTSYPWRTICSLLITARDDSRWIGTGWLVGNRTVITAGHVVYIHGRGGWAKSVEVIPGRNAAARPYGSCVATSLRSVKGWTQKRKRSRDYGAIILPRSCDYGKRLGYLGYGNYSRSTLRNLTVNLSGYPGDKPSGTQWWHARRIKSVTSRTLVYNIDTAGGQSGSPVWRVRNGKRYAVGIHTNGSSSGNSATRITKAVFKNIKKWKAEGQS
jgi:glutamyl endopeptidase